MKIRLFAFGLALSTLVGCSGDKSLVAMSATVESPALEIQSRSSVGAEWTGHFSLVLALGEYASEDTEVSLGSFAIQRDDQELLSPLSLAGANFPLKLAIGKKVTLPLTFGASTDPDVADGICQAPVRVRGTLTDSLSNDHPTAAVSAVFAAQCD